MKNFISLVTLISFLASVSGCATLKNTKVPTSFNEVGICRHCKNAIALDGLQDDETAICPECGLAMGVKRAKYEFKRGYVDRRNQKTAYGVLTVTLFLASIAGAVYGIPIPVPPIEPDTFTPYKLPIGIRCRQAKPAPPLGEPVLLKAEDARTYKFYEDSYGSAALVEPKDLYAGPYTLVISDKCEDPEILLEGAG